MEKIERNTKVTIKNGAVIGGYKFAGGEISRVAGRSYSVKVMQHYCSGSVNQIHWVGRHGDYFFTDISNVKV